MEEEFYATMKLTSGEEIVAKVSYDSGDDVVIIHNPRLIEKIEIKKRNMMVEGLVFDDWINATQEDMFIIPRNQIITMIELDSRFIKFYEEHLTDKSYYKKRQPAPASSDERFYSKRQNPKNNEGYLGSIKDSKDLLEQIYKQS